MTASSMSCLTWKTNKMSSLRHKILEISHYRGRRNLTANRGWLRSNKESKIIDFQQRRKKPGENINSGPWRSMFDLARRHEKYYSHLFLDIFQQFLSQLLVWKPRRVDRTLFAIINRKTISRCNKTVRIIKLLPFEGAILVFRTSSHKMNIQSVSTNQGRDFVHAISITARRNLFDFVRFSWSSYWWRTMVIFTSSSRRIYLVLQCLFCSAKIFSPRTSVIISQRFNHW